MTTLTTIRSTVETTVIDDNAVPEETMPVMPKNVGHLLEEPTEIVCPACGNKSLTKVEHEAVTIVQKFVAVINFCLCCNPIKWSGRQDVNHYCSKCGCYIGRHIKLSWYKRLFFKHRRNAIESDSRWKRYKRIDKEQLDKSKQKQLVRTGRDEN